MEGFLRKAGPDLACIRQSLAGLIVVAKEQSSEPRARTLGIGKTANHKFLPAYALDFDPVGTPAEDVRAFSLLANDPFAALAAGLLPKLRALFGLIIGPANSIGPANRLA